MPLKRRFATQPAVWRTGARVVFYEVVNKLFVAAAVAVAVVVFRLQSCCNVHSERPAPVAAVKINFGKVSEWCRSGKHLGRSEIESFYFEQVLSKLRKIDT